MQKFKIWGPKQDHREQYNFQVQGKKDLIGPNFFSTFNLISDTFSCITQNIKILTLFYMSSVRYANTWGGALCARTVVEL